MKIQLVMLLEIFSIRIGCETLPCSYQQKVEHGLSFREKYQLFKNPLRYLILN